MISIKVRNLDKVVEFLREMPRGVLGVAVRAAAENLLGDDSTGLRHYPGYKYVTRKAAYGQTFFSDRQRRWFFANLAEGNIHPGQDNRTGAIAAGWNITGSGTNIRLTNRVPGVGWVMGTNQARQPARVGWRKVDDIIRSNIPSTVRAMVAAVNAWIREHIK